MTDELLSEFGEYVGSWTLAPASGGRFEVTINGNLVFSKEAEGRFPAIAELREKFEAAV